MAGLVPAIHVLLDENKKGVDARDKPGHDVEKSHAYHAAILLSRAYPSKNRPEAISGRCATGQL